jgi:hypothetical protein
MATAKKNSREEGGEDHKIAFRLDEETLKKIDDYGELLKKESPPGLKLTRTDIVRVLLLRGLEVSTSQKKK